jgi:hypothetical protein
MMSDNHENPLALKDSSVRYMNAYERARARQRMEQAMALVDRSIHTWAAVRAALNRVGNSLRGAFVPQG